MRKSIKKLLRHIRSVPCALVLEISIQNAEPVTTTKLQKISAILLNAGSSCLPITPIYVSLSAPLCALKSPKRIIDSFDPTL